jgi:DNA-binding response OmpR family regulator
LPIIILTGLAGDHDVVRGLSSGANDYISKPFRAAELAARLHAQLRVFDGSEDAVFSVGPYVFQPSKKQLRDSIKKQVIRLTDKEVSLLRFLCRSDTGVNRGTLLAQVWGYDSGVTTHTLETHMYRLRQKIEVDPGHPALLVTEGHRYRLAKNGPPENA